MTKSTIYLHFKPSLIKGLSRLADLMGSTDNYDQLHLEDDIETLRNDWYGVGADLKNAIRAYDRNFELVDAEEISQKTKSR